MVNFELEVIQKVEALISANSYKEALELVNSELAMPYVEKSFKETLLAFKEKIVTESMLVEQDTEKTLSPTKVKEFLYSDENAQLAVLHLSKSNIRSYINLVQEYLLSDKRDRYICSLLISVCIEQQVLDELTYMDGNVEIKFIPHYLELPHETDGFKKVEELFEKWFGNNEVSLVHMCNDVLQLEGSLRLPQSIEEAESLYIGLSIVKYVFKAWNRTDEFIALLESETVSIERLPSLMIEND